VRLAFDGLPRPAVKGYGPRVDDWPKEWLAEHPSKRCPTCGEPAVRPVMFGMPVGSVWEAMETGIIDIHLGGCTLPGPSYRCSACNQQLSVGPGRRLVPFDGDWPDE
jgi:hypothetical protein